jgi:putative transposase
MNARRLLQVSQKGKVRKAKKYAVRSLEEYGALDYDGKVAMIETLIPLGLMHISDLLQKEVRDLAGEKYKRNGLVRYDRWGSQGGSVYLWGQRVPLEVPRVRDTRAGREKPLTSYARFQTPSPEAEELLCKRVVSGLSCGDYKGCSEAIPEAMGLSPSSVSRRVIRASQKKLQNLLERRLERYDFVALIIDGKRFGDDGIIVAIGVTMKGEKIILGIIESDTENHIVVRDFLRGLVDRGLLFRDGLLFVVDGARGFRKAIKDVFGRYALVQRCQWHKRENIVSYLPKRLQQEYRRKLQQAYELDDYKAARDALLEVRRELGKINESAVKSFDEGFEETLTVLRLGLSKELRRSLKTTNCIDSVFSQVGAKTDKVDHWKNSNQRQRWTASVLLLIEPRLNKISGYRQIKSLRIALQKEIRGEDKTVLIKREKEVEVA